MTQMTGPILAITLVLLSVFLLVAFIPGITGQLFQQFAAVVAFSMLISAVVLVLIGFAVFGAGWLFKVTPTGFLPEEDQGAFMAEIQLPQGASVSRTLEVVKEVEQIVMQDPAVQYVMTVPGYSLLDGAIESNAALLIGRLKPFEERTDPELKVQAVIGRVAAQTAAIPAARVMPFNLPPIIGLGTGSGFEYQLEDLQGRPPEELAAVMRAMVLAANQDPDLDRVFSTWATDNPQIYLDIDREKAQTLGIQISDVFTALQVTLGGYYVNDFNKFGRVWQVQVQGEEQDRVRFDDVYRVHVRNGEGDMVPIRAFMEPRLILGPQLIQRYNNYGSTTIQGGPAPGRSRARP